MNTLKQRMQDELGLPDECFDGHETDLYVVKTPETENWLRENYKFFGYVETFVCDIDGDDWYDIPFGKMYKSN